MLDEHGVDQQPGTRIFVGRGVHSLLFGERVRDQLGLTPSDQRFGGGGGSGQIAP